MCGCRWYQRGVLILWPKQETNRNWVRYNLAGAKEALAALSCKKDEDSKVTLLSYARTLPGLCPTCRMLSHES